MFLFVVSCVCLGMSFILKSVDLVTGNQIDRKDFRKRYIKEVLKDDVHIEEYWLNLVDVSDITIDLFE